MIECFPMSSRAFKGFDISKIQRFQGLRDEGFQGFKAQGLKGERAPRFSVVQRFIRFQRPEGSFQSFMVRV